VRVADAAERNSVYPAPVQGNTVFRADLGYEEKYYAAYNANTNPDGTTGTPGWYQYAGGAPLSRNHVLNSHFGINQRNFSTTSTTSTYGFDRWLFVYNGGTATYSAQNFTTSDAPISNYESNQYARIVTSGQSGSGIETRLVQRIEDVTSLAGKTVTVSFWAKAASGTPSIAVEMGQVFGTGGSPSSAVLTYAGKSQISNSWNRYSVSVNIPSISEKVLGTNANSSYLALQLYVSAGTDYNARTGSLGVQNNTFDIWGVQLEEGPVPTPFRRNQPNIQAELAACQRYYQRINPEGTPPFRIFSLGWAFISTGWEGFTQLPVSMRTPPTSIDTSPANTFQLSDNQNTAISLTGVSIIASQTGSSIVCLSASGASGMTQYRNYILRGNNNTSAYIGLSAEL